MLLVEPVLVPSVPRRSRRLMPICHFDTSHMIMADMLSRPDKSELLKLASHAHACLSRVLAQQADLASEHHFDEMGLRNMQASAKILQGRVEDLTLDDKTDHDFAMAIAGDPERNAPSRLASWLYDHTYVAAKDYHTEFSHNVHRAIMSLTGDMLAWLSRDELLSHLLHCKCDDSAPHPVVDLLTASLLCLRLARDMHFIEQDFDNDDPAFAKGLLNTFFAIGAVHHARASLAPLPELDKIHVSVALIDPLCDGIDPCPDSEEFRTLFRTPPDPDDLA